MHAAAWLSSLGPRSRRQLPPACMDSCASSAGRSTPFPSISVPCSRPD